MITNLTDLKKFEDLCLTFPSKTLVKKINGISLFSFEHFTIYGKEYKIMLCGTIHNYCYNKTFCKKPCLNKDKCYSLTELINKYSRDTCIDLFTETRLDKRLKTFKYYNLGSKDKPQNNIVSDFENMINHIFKFNNLNFFIKHNKEAYKEDELMKLDEDDYVKEFQSGCLFKKDLFTKETLRKIYNYLKKKPCDFTDGEKKTPCDFTDDEKKKIFHYINYSIK